MIELPLAPDEAVRFTTALAEGASALNAELERYRKGGASAELIDIVTKAREELDIQRLRIEARFDSQPVHQLRRFGPDYACSCGAVFDESEGDKARAHVAQALTVTDDDHAFSDARFARDQKIERWDRS